MRHSARRTVGAIARTLSLNEFSLKVVIAKHIGETCPHKLADFYCRMQRQANAAINVGRITTGACPRA